VPQVVLHARVPDGEQFGGQARFQRVRAERPQRDAGGREQRAQDGEELRAQEAFFFFARCERVLP
jgi:hypothetical protein